MGLYRATVNQPEARAGQTAWFDDYDRDIRKRVLHGHLIAVDETAKSAQAEVVTVGADDPKPVQEAIRDALKAARERAAAEEVPSAVKTAVTAPEAAVEEAPEVEIVEPSPVVKPKRRS